jgi:cell division protein FtsB
MRGIKNREGGKWKRPAAFVILFIILIILLNSVKNVYQKKKMAQETLTKTEKEISDLKNRDQFLKESIEKMATKEGTEFEIRKKLNVAQAGEGVAIIVDQNTSSSVQTTAISSWQNFKNFFSWLFK